MPKNEKNLFALVQGYKIENLSDSYNVLSNETFQEYEANFTNRIPEYQRNYVATVDWATTLVKSMFADLLDSDEEISTYCLQNITVQELVTKDGQIIKFVRNIVGNCFKTFEEAEIAGKDIVKRQLRDYAERILKK